MLFVSGFYWRKYDNYKSYQNGKYGDSVENVTFYGGFMIKLFWGLSMIFMEKR